ncbi:L,D-transpeptidase, partial [Rhizobium johnstonii]
IGRAVSNGCIRLTNSNIVDLYSRARVGTRVVFI